MDSSWEGNKVKLPQSQGCNGVMGSVCWGSQISHPAARDKCKLVEDLKKAEQRIKKLDRSLDRGKLILQCELQGRPPSYKMTKLIINEKVAVIIVQKRAAV